MKPSDAKVLRLLRDRGDVGLTQLDCLVNGGGSRLAARVSDLRGAGYDITTDLIVVPVRGGGRARVARYVLHEKPDQLELGVA